MELPHGGFHEYAVELSGSVAAVVGVGRVGFGDSGGVDGSGVCVCSVEGVGGYKDGAGGGDGVEVGSEDGAAAAKRAERVSDVNSANKTPCLWAFSRLSVSAPVNLRRSQGLIIPIRSHPNRLGLSGLVELLASLSDPSEGVVDVGNGEWVDVDRGLVNHTSDGGVHVWRASEARERGSDGEGSEKSNGKRRRVQRAG